MEFVVVCGGGSVSKFDVALRFVRDLVCILGSRVYAVILFGSVAKGFADECSDIDIMVVVDCYHPWIDHQLADLCHRYFVEFGEVIEPLVVSLEEYFLKLSSNPLYVEVKKFGKVLYVNEDVVKDHVKKLLDLSNHYREVAEVNYRMGYVRVSVDLLHNAIELLLKALIMVKERPLPRTHGGYIHVFAELYRDVVPENLIAKLHKALRIRNMARYDPEYVPSEDEWTYVKQVYELVRECVKKVLGY